MREFTKDVDHLAEKLASIIDRQARTPDVFDSRRCAAKIESALVDSLGMERERAREIAFHFGDWLLEAGFLIALSSDPQAFSENEVAESVTSFLAHVPNHAAAAAKLFGLPVQDLFDLGVLEEEVE